MQVTFKDNVHCQDCTRSLHNATTNTSDHRQLAINFTLLTSTSQK